LLSASCILAPLLAYKEISSDTTGLELLLFGPKKTKVEATKGGLESTILRLS